MKVVPNAMKTIMVKSVGDSIPKFNPAASEYSTSIVENRVEPELSLLVLSYDCSYLGNLQ